MRSRAFGLAAIVAASGAAAVADVTDIDSVQIQERRFNDYSGSTLVTTNNFPSLVRFDESNFGSGGFANQHVAWFSGDGGASHYDFARTDRFVISLDVTLDVGSTSPRKEAGFRFDTFQAGEAFFFVTSDGEVAAFGGMLPFHSFGHVYTPGSTASLSLIYTPDDDGDAFDGDASTFEYVYNGTSSGPLAVSNLENGILDGTQGGFYVQNQPDDNNPSDFSVASFANISIAVPTPASGAVLALAGLGALRRRRHSHHRR
ncbi:MAG TPA: hypothetical protein VFF69_00730 [Phycisphaerales bacterium]|nr:hypothetical protein [Phycisphaerales bacterium]